MTTKEQVLEKLKEIKDPEIGMDIIALGLVRNVTIDDDGVEILMTLTSPFCPYADKIVKETEKAAQSLEDAGDVRVEITFDPPWEPPEEVKALMNLK
jgi:metal-sulfur cluster biosynthetic enzyme